MNNYINVNQVAFCTTTALAAATIGCTFGAVATTAIAAKVSYTAAAVLFGSVSIGSITAWADTTSGDVGHYFTKLKDHSAIAIASMSQLIAQTLVQALVQGMAAGVSKSITRSIAGDDVTVKVKNARQ